MVSVKLASAANITDHAIPPEKFVNLNLVMLLGSYDHLRS
jgi:hypothetical protein